MHPNHKVIRGHKHFRIIPLEKLDMERLIRCFNAVTRKARDNREIHLSLTTEVFQDIGKLNLSDNERRDLLSHSILMDVYGSYFDQEVVKIISGFIDDFDNKVDDIMRRFHVQNRRNHKTANAANQNKKVNYYYQKQL